MVHDKDENKQALIRASKTSADYFYIAWKYEDGEYAEIELSLVPDFLDFLKVYGNEKTKKNAENFNLHSFMSNFHQ